MKELLKLSIVFTDNNRNDDDNYNDTHNGQ